MGKQTFKVEIKGVDAAIRRAGSVRDQLIRELDRDVEESTVNFTNNAKRDAPRLTGNLANQIQIRERATMARTVRGEAEYTARQEYEHATRKGFFRNNLAREANLLRSRIMNTLRRVGR